MEQDDDLECCGNGCNNCVLDTIKPKGSNNVSKRKNVLSSGYVIFRLISITQCTANVFQLEFQYDQDQFKSVNRENFCLNIALANYLMLRTKYFTNPQLSPDFQNFQSDDGLDGITLKYRKNKHDKDTEDGLISRPYTPIDVDSDNLTFKILVKLLKHGVMSQYIASLQLGDLTEWKGSYGHFEYVPNKYKSIIFISQGVGIAPTYRISKSLLNDETDETRIQMVACFKNMEGILLREELYSMKHFWNFDYAIYISRPEGNCKLKYNECIKLNRLDKIEMSHILNATAFNNNSIVVVCGGEPFSNCIKNILIDLGHCNFVIL